MGEGQIDRTQGQINQIDNALKDMMGTLHRASQLHAETAEKLAAASERHTQKLVTWAR